VAREPDADHLPTDRCYTPTLRVKGRGLTITGAKLRHYMRCRRLPFMNAFETRRASSQKPPDQEESDDRSRFVDEPSPLSKTSSVAWSLADRKDSVEIMPARTATEAAFETTSAMRAGQRVIVGPVLGSENWWARPTALLRVDGSSNFGRWNYQIIDEVRAKKHVTAARIVATFYSEVLRRVQGSAPEVSVLTNGLAFKEDVRCTEFIDETMGLVTELETILRERRDPEPEIRSSVCSRCEWQTVCAGDARERGSLFQLSGASRGSVAFLKNEGIENLSTLASHPRALPILSKTPGLRRTAGRTLAQAQAYVSGTSRLLGRPQLPSAAVVELFVDFEGLGRNNRTDATVMGLLVRRNHGKPKPKVFVVSAPKKRAQQDAWLAFLKAIVRELPDGPIFHFGGYDRAMFEGMHAVFGGAGDIIPRLVDVHPVARTHAVIPDRSISAKALAKALGLPIRHSGMTGSEAIDLWSEWSHSKSRGTLRKLREYNEDDLRTVMSIVDWLRGRIPA
jgi:predicted RecB family nuclease